MPGIWERFKAARLQRSALLVCAGSEGGRVPFAFVSRDCGKMAKADGRVIHLRHTMDNGVSWDFKIITCSPEIAEDLAAQLRRRELHSIHPNDRIATILFHRDDWGTEPMWIGGDIRETDASPEEYVRNGNRAYIHRNSRQI